MPALTRLNALQNVTVVTRIPVKALGARASTVLNHTPHIDFLSTPKNIGRRLRKQRTLVTFVTRPTDEALGTRITLHTLTHQATLDGILAFVANFPRTNLRQTDVVFNDFDAVGC